MLFLEGKYLNLKKKKLTNNNTENHTKNNQRFVHVGFIYYNVIKNKIKSSKIRGVLSCALAQMTGWPCDCGLASDARALT